MALKDLLSIAILFLSVATPVVIGVWRLFVFPLSSMREDIKRVREERNEEIGLRKDLKKDFEDLSDKHDTLVEERRIALDKRREEMEALQKKIDDKDGEFQGQLSERNNTINDLTGKIEAVLRLRESESLQKEALWQRYQTINNSYGVLTGQVESMVTSIGTLQERYEKELEKMNSKMEERYLKMQAQLDENVTTATNALARVENARRFLLQIPGLSEDEVNKILQGQTIWEDVKPVVLQAVKTHDTGSLNPDALLKESVNKENVDGPEYVAGAASSPLISSVPGKLDSDQRLDGRTVVE